MENALFELRQEEIRTQTRNIERKIANVTIDTPTPTQQPQPLNNAEPPTN
jgi:hypothetical protein